MQRRRHRVAAESAEQRAARLQQMSTTQSERRAAESAEQRAAKLQQMSTTQSEDGLPSQQKRGNASTCKCEPV